MVPEQKPEQPKEEEKKEIRYLNKASISGGNKMFKCDVMTGIITAVKPKKQYFRVNKSSPITVEPYIEVAQNEFYVSARNKEDAKGKFEAIFFDIEKKIAEEGENMNIVMQEQVIQQP